MIGVVQEYQEYVKSVKENLELLPDLLQAISDRAEELEAQGDFASYHAIRHALNQLDEIRRFLNGA